MERTSDPLQLMREIEALEPRAQQAAFTLHTMCYLSCTPQDIEQYTHVVRSLYSFTALLPTLRWYISPAFYSSRPFAPISGPEKIERLSRRVGECEIVVQQIETASKMVLNWSWLLAEENNEHKKGPVEFLPLGLEEVAAAYATLEMGVKDALVALTAARANMLSHKSSAQTDKDISELLFLKNALKHPKNATLSALFGFKDLPMAGPTTLQPDQAPPAQGVMTAPQGSNAPPTPSSPTPPPSEQESKGEEKATQEADMSSTDPDITIMANSLSKVHVTSTPEPTPPAEHFEAYMIRPSLSDDSVLSYYMESVPLPDADVETHIRKLGDNHSVINDLCALPLTQGYLVRMRAKQRNGTVAFAQRCSEVDMQTKTGMVKAAGVLFAIQTRSPREDDTDLGEYDIGGRPVSSVAARNFTTGGFGSGTTAGGFSSSTTPGMFGSGTTTGGFGSAPKPQSNFGGFGPPPPFAPRDNPYEAAATEDTQRLRRKLEQEFGPCTYVEPEAGRTNQMAHYQTIIPTLTEEISFEELRKLDMDAGRNGPIQSGTMPQPARQPAGSSSGFGASSGGLFGDASRSTGGLFGPSSTTQSGSGGLFGSSKQPGGLFGQQGITQSSSGGLFGQHSTTQSSSRSLFGQPVTTQSTSGGLFGPGRPSNTGLFGNTQGTTPSPFGAPQSSSGGLFGSTPSVPQNVNQPTRSIFGGAQPAHASSLDSGSVPGFGQTAPASGGLFGAPRQALHPPAGGLFSQAPSGGLFGHENTVSTPATTSGGLFGHRTSKAASSGSLFGTFAANPTPATSSQGSLSANVLKSVEALLANLEKLEEQRAKNEKPREKDDGKNGDTSDTSKVSKDIEEDKKEA